jgi:hypothetical protein
MSLSASGSLGGVLSYGSVAGTSYARIPGSTSQPDTDPQIAVRACFEFLASVWKTFDPSVQQLWNVPGSRRRSPYQNFVGFNSERMRLGDPPVDRPDPTPIAAPSAPVLSGTAGNALISLTITVGAVPPNWGWMLYRFPFPGLPRDPTKILKLIDAGVTVSINLYAIPAITRTYRVAGFHDSGVFGPLSNSKALTPY